MDQMLSQLGSHDPALAEVAGEGGHDDELAVIVRLSEEQPLPAGTRIVSRFGDIATVRLPRGRLDDLAESDAVVALERPRRLRLTDIEADAVMECDDGATPCPAYTRRPNGVTATGRGVIVAALDWGVDFAHPALRHADGSTRILSLWDQRGPANGHGNRWGYGRIISRQEIDRALGERDPYEALGYNPADSDEFDEERSAWKGAHGTHVLDIAAGNGGGGGAPGVAPESEIVFVHLSRTAKPLGRDNLGDSATVLEALDFVFSLAGDRPCVVNMSIGAHGGPHDGTTMAELGIDQAVWLKSGRTCVNSAGNYHDSRVHAQGKLEEGGEEVIRFDVPAGDPTDSELELYYESVDRFMVSIDDPSGACAATVAPGQDSPIRVDGRTVGHVYHRSRGVTHGDRHVDVFFDPQAPGGTWQLRLTGEVVEDGRYHAWIERDAGLRPRFVPSCADANSTTGTLCNGRYSVTVGAHRNDRSLAAFSSGGPTRDGRAKPELAASGQGIVAARSTPRGELPAARYTTKSGTSMAAPHVTGTIALMYEAAGRPMEIVETRALLFSSVDCTSIGDGSPPATDLHRVGYGFLNIAAAEAAAREWGRSGRTVAHDDAAPEMEKPQASNGDSAMSDHIEADLLTPDAASRAEAFEETDATSRAAPAPQPPALQPPDLRGLDPRLIARGFRPVDAEMSELPMPESVPEDSDDVGLAKDTQGDRWSEAAWSQPDDPAGTKAVGADRADASSWSTAPRDFREAFLELAEGGDLRDADDLRVAALSIRRRGQAEPRAVSGSGDMPLATAGAGDLLVRSAPDQGVGYTAVVLSDPEPPEVLRERGIAVERGGPGLYVEVAEIPPEGGPMRTVGRRLTDHWGRTPRGQSVVPSESIGLAEDDPPPTTDPDTNPLSGWEAEQDSLVLLVGDNKLIFLPSSSLGVITPAARLRNIDWRQVAVERDLGTLLQLPAVGAGGSRIFKAGPRLAVMLDAGRNPQRQPAAAYMPQILARARDLGVSEVRTVVLIHRHTDHTNEVPAIVDQYGITAANVIMPNAFARQVPTRDYTAVINALRQRFGASWQPGGLDLRPASPSGDLVRGRYTLGTTSFEFFADAAALRRPQHTDAASLLTRVTRRGDLNAIVVLGDLRGADLATFHTRMGADAWREFFRGVEVIDGFSHHRGAMTAADIPGIMRLLEATLLKTGRLVVTLQTDPGQHVPARADTLEFMRRIGVEVHEVHVGGTGRTSGVQATTRGATTTGPHARSHTPIPSGLIDAIGRIAQLRGARDTLVLWGPHIARQNPSFNQTAELRQIDQSLEQLGRATRAAAEAAANVRVSGGRTSAGTRDYTGGTRGAAFAALLAAIPPATAAETAIGTAGFAQIARLQRIPAGQVPLVVALNDALINGRYSQQAFRYMISQLDPATLRGIFSGPRGGARGQLEVFQRVRAEFGFRQSVLGSMNVMSAAHLRPGLRGGARGVAGVLAVVEIGNLVAQGVQSYRISQATAHRQNIAPFLRRLAFWRQLRVATSAVAVDDPTLGSTTYERDPAKIDTGLANGDWDFLYIEHTAQRPALSDAEILKVIAMLGQMVRNYDEYATLFVDSRQDAIRFVPVAGTPWSQSRWEVRVGDFSTSGTNHVTDRWVELPLLTEGMNAIVRRVMANTNELLARIGRGEPAETQELGTLQHPRGRPLYRGRLKPGNATPIELRIAMPQQWSGSGGGGGIKKLFHRVTWQTTRRPEFYIWQVTDQVDAHVSGADFETYYRLRDLESIEYQVGSRGSNLNALYSRPAGNEKGDAWMLTSDFDQI